MLNIFKKSDNGVETEKQKEYPKEKQKEHPKDEEKFSGWICKLCADFLVSRSDSHCYRIVIGKYHQGYIDIVNFPIYCCNCNSIEEAIDRAREAKTIAEVIFPKRVADNYTLDLINCEGWTKEQVYETCAVSTNLFNEIAEGKKIYGDEYIKEHICHYELSDGRIVPYPCNGRMKIDTDKIIRK